MSFPKFLWFLGEKRRKPLQKDMPYAFTINHHCCQQALLVGQSVMSLALLVPKAGQTLRAGKVLTDCMLHTGTQAVCASRPRARRKQKVCINQVVRQNSKGTLCPSSKGQWGWSTLLKQLPCPCGPHLCDPRPILKVCCHELAEKRI